jgi:tetratricopeptide (TPR) repeat protein
MRDYQERRQEVDLLQGARDLAQLEPDNPARWAALIGLLRAMHLDAECVTTIRKAMQLNVPEDFRHELTYQLVDRLMVMGETSEASRALDQLQQSEGLSQRVRVKQIELYRLEGSLEEALRSIEAGFPDRERTPELFALRGAIYLDLARFDEAAADLERAIARKPFDEVSQFKLAEAYRGLGRKESAQRHRDLATGIESKRARINKLLQKLPNEPDNPQLFRQLAELHRELDEREAAEDWERRAARFPARVPTP